MFLLTGIKLLFLFLARLRLLVFAFISFLSYALFAPLAPASQRSTFNLQAANTFLSSRLSVMGDTGIRFGYRTSLPQHNDTEENELSFRSFNPLNVAAWLIGSNREMGSNEQPIKFRRKDWWPQQWKKCHHCGMWLVRIHSWICIVCFGAGSGLRPGQLPKHQKRKSRLNSFSGVRIL